MLAIIFIILLQIHYNKFNILNCLFINLKNNKHQPDLINSLDKMTLREHNPILIVPGEQYLSQKQCFPRSLL